MSAIRATVVTVAMLLAMVAVVTGISANSGAEIPLVTDGYGISSHMGSQ